MLDGPQIQRSFGTAQIAMTRGRLLALRQSGSAKVMLPRCHQSAPEIVFLNTSGGLTAGDRLEYRLDLGPDSQATATTQTAERAYRAEGPPARARVRLSLDRGARLDWLPQETILYDGAKLERETEIDLAPKAQILAIETIILGRAAHGETLRRVTLSDRRQIRRDGKLVLLDPMRLGDGAVQRAGNAALLGGMRAIATLFFVAPDAPAALPSLRAELTEPDVKAAVSSRDGAIILRCLAPDGWPLRRQMIRLVQKLRPGALPRVWQI